MIRRLGFSDLPSCYTIQPIIAPHSLPRRRTYNAATYLQLHDANCLLICLSLVNKASMYSYKSTVMMAPDLPVFATNASVSESLFKIVHYPYLQSYELGSCRTPEGPLTG